MAKILVVDDAAFMRMRAVKLLTEEGHQVLEAENGAVALKVYKDQKPDVVLLDITMPEMDGIETCRRLKGNPDTAPIPVLALTTHDEPSTVFAMMEAGALLYLTKPVASERLLSAINLALSISGP